MCYLQYKMILAKITHLIFMIFFELRFGKTNKPEIN